MGFVRNFRLVVTVLAAVALTSSCAEYVGINSNPHGANAYVDGKFIGTTPAWTHIPRSEVGPDHTFKVAASNCDPAEGKLPVYVAPGRVVGYIFTAGILGIFKGPSYFPEVDVDLQGGDCIARKAAPVPDTTTPTVQVIQIVGDGNSSVRGTNQSSTQKLESQLGTLRSLYKRKLISEAEYEKERNRAIEAFGKASR